MILNIVSKLHRLKPLHLSLSRMASVAFDSNQLLEMIWKTCPPLDAKCHKGQIGRIGIIGGSPEYTGAPYFAGMAALRVGADGTHIFCMRDAAIPIKCYSPDIIVHPILDADDPLSEMLEWIPRLHVLVIGPGLGRKPQIFSTVGHILHMAKDRQLPIVIDADGLFYLNENYDVIEGYSKAVLTPNRMEMARLYRSVIHTELQADQVTPEHVQKLAIRLGVTILCKGHVDIIACGNHLLMCDTEGSLRRCMGQGDVLSGATAVLLYWASIYPNLELPPTALASWGACDITRKVAAKTFSQVGRSMLTADLLKNIGSIAVQLSEQRNQ